MTSSYTLQHYARHDALTHPAGLASLYEALPSGAPALCDVLSGLIVHTSWADRYGIPPGTPLPRETKPIAERLAEIQQRFAGSLVAQRAPTQRPFGTCRDFALLLCSTLRHRGTPARVRCGFATYFENVEFADHWICEHWIADEQRWAMADAQLDRFQRSHLGVTFDPADLPEGAYLTATAAWMLVRSGGARAEDFGHGDARGLWFLSMNLRRDILALANRHVSAWDTWRRVDADSRRLTDEDLVACDRLAAIAAAAVASGDTRALEELGTASLTPPWQQTADAGNRRSPARADPRSH
jgi:hypothetical protein